MCRNSYSKYGVTFFHKQTLYINLKKNRPFVNSEMSFSLSMISNCVLKTEQLSPLRNLMAV